MGTKKLSERHIRKIMLVNDCSFSITLPKEIVQELGWRKKQKVTVKKNGNKIIIEDWKK